MAQPAVFVVNGVAASPPYVVDINNAPVQVGLGIKVSATATAVVQHTYDDLMRTDPAQAVWYSHPALNNVTANAFGSYLEPIRAVRINVTASTGTVTLTVVPGGNPNGV